MTAHYFTLVPTRAPRILNLSERIESTLGVEGEEGLGNIIHHFLILLALVTRATTGTRYIIIATLAPVVGVPCYYTFYVLFDEFIHSWFSGLARSLMYFIVLFLPHHTHSISA